MRPDKFKFALVSSVMMVLQGPPTVAIETALLATAVSLGYQYMSDSEGEEIERRRTNQADRSCEACVEGVEAAEDCVFRATLDQDVLLGSRGCTDERDAGKSCDSHSKEARDEHCRI